MFAASPKGSLLNEKKKSSIQPKATIKDVQSDDQEDYDVAIDQETQTNLGLNVKPKVQEDFRNLLLEFVINCLLDQPKDVINYAADYFVELQERQHTMIIRDYEASEEANGLSSGTSSEVGSKRSRSGKSASSSEKETRDEDDAPKFDGDIAKLTDRSTSIQKYG